MNETIRYVRVTPGIRVVVLRGLLFGPFIAVIHALLPVVGLKPSSNSSLFFLDPDSLGNVLCLRESLLVRKWKFSTFPPGFLSGPRLNPKLCAFFRTGRVERDYFWRQDNEGKEIEAN